MSLERLMTQSCDVYRSTVAAATGPEPVETFAAAATGVACRIWLNSAKELSDQHQTTVTGWRAIMPYGTTLYSRDRLYCESRWYEVEMVNPNPGGQQHHVEAILRQVAQ